MFDGTYDFQDLCDVNRVLDWLHEEEETYADWRRKNLG
jgi:hypothetical protein